MVSLALDRWNPTRCVRSTVGMLGLVLSLSGALAASGAERPSAPKLLPENTLAYVRVAGADEFVEKVKQTSMGRMLNDDEVRPLVGEFYRLAADAFNQVRDDVGLSLDELLSIPQGELCAAVVGSTAGPPVFVLVADVGDQLKHADTLINRAIQEAGNNNVRIEMETHAGVEMTILSPPGSRNTMRLVVFTRDSTVVLCTAVETAKQLLDVWDGTSAIRTLADNRAFTAIMSQSTGTKEERPQLSWFADPINLVRNIGRGNVGAQVGLALLSPLGLDDLEGLGGSAIIATEEFDSIGHFHMLLKNPRRGVLKMLAMTSGDSTPEPWVPKDATGYMTIHWDMNVTYTELATMYDLIYLQEGGMDKLVKSRFSDRLGVDVRNELLPLLGGRYTMATAIERPVRVNSQVTGVGIRIKDTEAFQKVLDKITAKYPEALERQTYGASVYYRIPMGRQPPPDFDQSMMRLPQPAFAVVGDYLVLSDSAKFIERCLVAQATPGESLADDPEYKLVSERIRHHTGGRIPGFLSFARPEETLKSFYELATAETTRQRLTQAAADNPFFKQVDGALSAHPLPPFEVIAKYLAPAGAMMLSDETGFHYISFGLKGE